MNSRTSLTRWLKITVTATVLAMGTAAGIHAVQSYEFATPIFKLAVAPDGSLLVLTQEQASSNSETALGASSPSWRA